MSTTNTTLPGVHNQRHLTWSPQPTPPYLESTTNTTLPGVHNQHHLTWCPQPTPPYLVSTTNTTLPGVHNQHHLTWCPQPTPPYLVSTTNTTLPGVHNQHHLTWCPQPTPPYLVSTTNTTLPGVHNQHHLTWCPQTNTTIPGVHNQHHLTWCPQPTPPYLVSTNQHHLTWCPQPTPPYLVSTTNTTLPGVHNQHHLTWCPQPTPPYLVSTTNTTLPGVHKAEYKYTVLVTNTTHHTWCPQGRIQIHSVGYQHHPTYLVSTRQNTNTQCWLPTPPNIPGVHKAEYKYTVLVTNTTQHTWCPQGRIQIHSVGYQHHPTYLVSTRQYDSVYELVHADHAVPLCTLFPCRDWLGLHRTSLHQNLAHLVRMCNFKWHLHYVETQQWSTAIFRYTLAEDTHSHTGPYHTFGDLLKKEPIIETHFLCDVGLVSQNENIVARLRPDYL